MLYKKDSVKIQKQARYIFNDVLKLESLNNLRYVFKVQLFTYDYCIMHFLIYMQVDLWTII